MIGDSVPTGGTLKAGRRPKKIRPMKVAVPVASATGKNVRVLTSGIISSMAKITPPIGRVECGGDARARTSRDERDALPGFEPDQLTDTRTERGADLNDRALAPHRRAASDGEGRGERLDDRDDRPDAAFLVEDRVHDFRHAVSTGLGRESRHQKTRRPCRR